MGWKRGLGTNELNKGVITPGTIMTGGWEGMREGRKRGGKLEWAAVPG